MTAAGVGAWASAVDTRLGELEARLGAAETQAGSLAAENVVLAERLAALEAPGPDPVLLDQSFDDWATSTAAQPATAFWDQRMGVSGGAVNLKNVRVVDTALGRKALRLTLPAGWATLPTGGIDKGTAMFCPLARPVDEAILEYRVRFAHDFNPWGWGGKLPGLSGVAPGVTASKPTGGKGPQITDGWSARLMWVGKDAAGKSSYTSMIGARQNIGLLYTYGADGTKEYGDERWFDTPSPTANTFTSGRAHDVRLHCRLNTVGKADGLLVAQVDGVTVYESTVWAPRTRADVRITHLLMHAFRGGDTAEWGVATAEQIEIDHVKVTTP